MGKPIVYLFAGQGSQSYHMGRELYERVPAFRHHMDRLDAVARAMLGYSVLAVVMDPARQRFDPFERLLDSNPALFMLQYSLAAALAERGLRPAAAVGASLGEFVAMAVAEVLPAETLLALVIEFARRVEDALPPGGMLAILGPPAMVGQRPDLFAGVEIAGISADGHFVVAGTPDRLVEVERRLAAEQTACLRLPVRYPFHSSLMDTARASLGGLYGDRVYGTPRIPLVSCATADFVNAVGERHLWDIARQPIRLRDVFRGFEARQDSLFVDLSPSGTMATVAKFNLDPGSGSEIHAVMSLFGNEADGFARLCTRLGV